MAIGNQLRIVLTVSGSTQVSAYAIVVLWSIGLGDVNLAIPIAVSFVSSIGILAIFAFGELVKGVIGWRRFPGGQIRVYLGLPSLALLVLGGVLGGRAISQVVSSINLSETDAFVRIVAFFGTASLFAFLVMILYDLRDLRRKGEVPLLAPTQSVGGDQ